MTAPAKATPDRDVAPDAQGRAPTGDEAGGPAQLAADVRGLVAGGGPGPGSPGDPPPALRPSTVLGLQQATGNHVVASMMAITAQRVAVTNQATSETLFNQSAAGGQAGAAQYSINANYEMTRSGDTGATVQVRIKFLRQTRNTVPPPPGSPPGTPRVGQLVGPQTEIPAGTQRDWATNTMRDAIAHWNGRLTLIGEEWNAFQANTPKRLPVTFQAVPVWGIAEEAHNTVIVHPPSVVGGSTGNPIDAGNFYETKSDASYPANNDIIYAHEYGHLIGIPDEYSQSNAQMNALLHQAAPGSAASSLAALDRATVERMVLAAMSRPMFAQLQAAMPTVTGALRGQMALVKSKMATAARTGVTDPAVRAELTSELVAASDERVGRGVPNAVVFETTANFSSRNRAGAGVETALGAGALGTQIGDAYWRALREPHSTNVAVAGLGDVRLNVQGSIYGAAGAGTPQAGAASGLATSLVGPAAPAPAAGGPGGAPALPALPPPTTLAGQISALPATWASAGSALQAGVTPAAFATKMVAALRSAAAAAAPPPGAAPPPRFARAPDMWRRALQLVTNSSTEASRQLAVDLVATTVNPVLTSSVAAFQAAIQTEVNRIMTTSPAALAAAGTPDPNMVAMVAAMRARLDAAKAATAGTGRDPGAGAPAQDVTYSYQGLMGSNATGALRADQFAPLVRQFNSRLKSFWERDFRPEVR